MRAGMKKITAISAENPVDRIVIKPKIVANEDNYIEIKLSSIKEEREKEEARKLNNYNGHEFVDLGLPSGLKWATCNVGATKPEEYGDYFAWGETTTKGSYKASISKTYGVSMGDISGNPNYDVARATWGGTWRLPTSEEFEELIQCCTWTWTTENGQKGYKVTSRRNGNSIFLPSAGYRNGSSLNGAGSYGNYWTSSPYDSNIAYDLIFGSSGYKVDWIFRLIGHSVRAVSE